MAITDTKINTTTTVNKKSNAYAMWKPKYDLKIMYDTGAATHVCPPWFGSEFPTYQGPPTNLQSEWIENQSTWIQNNLLQNE